MRKKIIIIIILSVVWILLSGTFIDYQLHTGICDSPEPLHLSTSEIEEFNSYFSSFEGITTGNQVQKLIDKLRENSKTNADEPTMIPQLSYNSNGQTEDPNNYLSETFCMVSENHNTDTYEKYLDEIYSNLKSKHEYHVCITNGWAGLTNGITINYDKYKSIENFTIEGVEDGYKVRTKDWLTEFEDSNNK